LLGTTPTDTKRLSPAGKGSVHLSLRGKYTTTQMAQRAIDSYVEKVKVTKGVKTD